MGMDADTINVVPRKSFSANKLHHLQLVKSNKTGWSIVADTPAVQQHYHFSFLLIIIVMIFNDEQSSSYTD